MVRLMKSVLGLLVVMYKMKDQDHSMVLGDEKDGVRQR